MVKECKLENQKKWNERKVAKNIEISSDDEHGDSELEELQHLKSYKRRRIKKKDCFKFTKSNGDEEVKEREANRYKARRNESEFEKMQKEPKAKNS